MKDSISLHTSLRNSGSKQTPAIRLVIPYLLLQRLLEAFEGRRSEPMRFLRIGRCRVSDEAAEWLMRELLPDRLALAKPLPWERFAAFSQHDGSGLVPWVESHLPLLPLEVVAEVFIGTGAFEGKAWGFARGEDGRIVPMSELSLPGRWMNRIPLRVATGPILRGAADEECSRTVGGLDLNGAPVLGRMRGRPIVIYGTSRSGLFLAEGAVRLGIPLMLCDDRKLKRSHLGEISLLVGAEDVGRFKVEAFARRVSEWSLATAPVEPIVARADSPAGANAARRAAVLMDACDSDSGRLAVAMLATFYHKPQLSIACGVHFDAQGRRTLGADVRLLLPGDRCLLCMGGLTDYPRALRELAAPPPVADENAWRQERAGSLRSLNQTATGLGERMIEDLFAGRISESRWVRIEWDNDGRMAVREPDPGPRRTDCPLCAKAGEGDAALGLR